MRRRHVSNGALERPIVLLDGAVLTGGAQEWREWLSEVSSLGHRYGFDSATMARWQHDAISTGFPDVSPSSLGTPAQFVESVTGTPIEEWERRSRPRRFDGTAAILFGASVYLLLVALDIWSFLPLLALFWTWWAWSRWAIDALISARVITSTIQIVGVALVLSVGLGVMVSHGVTTPTVLAAVGAAGLLHVLVSTPRRSSRRPSPDTAMHTGFTVAILGGIAVLAALFVG